MAPHASCKQTPPGAPTQPDWTPAVWQFSQPHHSNWGTGVWYNKSWTAHTAARGHALSAAPCCKGRAGGKGSAAGVASRAMVPLPVEPLEVQLAQQRVHGRQGCSMQLLLVLLWLLLLLVQGLHGLGVGC